MASASDRATADPLIGLTLGDYVVEEAVGFGGMGIVYRAIHPLIGRKVAVKVLRPEHAADPEQASRFLKEAQALSGIKHRGIIDIIGFGKVPDGRQYMAMEFLEGESLEEEMRLGALPPARVVALADEILDALSAAHKVGVVHRDMKPSNVFMLRQSNNIRVVKLVDFGLARRATLGSLERVGEKASLMAGTPEYLAPEQANGLAATPRTDLYSLGVMLFEMLTGRLPFEEQGVIPLIEAHCSKPPPRVRTYVPHVPEALDELVDEMMRKAPGDRPQSAQEVRQRIQRIGKDLHEASTMVTYVNRPSGEKQALATPQATAASSAQKPAVSGARAAVSSPRPPQRPSPPTQAELNDATAESLQQVSETSRLGRRGARSSWVGRGLVAAVVLLGAAALFALYGTDPPLVRPPGWVKEEPAVRLPPPLPVPPPDGVVAGPTPPPLPVDPLAPPPEDDLAPLPDVKSPHLKRPRNKPCSRAERSAQAQEFDDTVQTWRKREVDDSQVEATLARIFDDVRSESADCAATRRKLKAFQKKYLGSR